MKTDQLLREILPSVIVDNFDVENFEKTEERFDIWLSEKKVQVREGVSRNLVGKEIS